MGFDSAANLATLGLIVDATGARRELKELTGDLQKAKVAGVETRDALKAVAPQSTVAQIDKMTAALQRMRSVAGRTQGNRDVIFGSDMTSLIQANDIFQKQAKSLDTAAKAAHGHGLAIGRINNALEALAVEAVGANSKLASIGGKFLEFGVGGIVTAAVLAGLAAIAFAWEKITENARKAREEYQKQIDLLRSIKREQDLGPGGEAGDAVKAGRARLQILSNTINSRQRLIDRGGLQGQSLGFTMAERDAAIKEYTELSLLVQAGEKKVSKVISDAAEDRARELAERNDEELRVLIEHMKAKEGVIERFQRQRKESAARSGELSEFGVGFANTRSAISVGPIGTSVFASLEAVGLRAKQAVEDAAKTAKNVREMTDQEKMEVSRRATLRGIGQDILGSIPGGGIINAGIAAAAGGPTAVAAAGVFAFGKAVFGAGQAAREAKARLIEMAASLEDTILGWKASLGIGGAQGILDQRHIIADAEAARKALYQIYGMDQNGRPLMGIKYNKDLLAEYYAKLKEVNELQAQRIAQLGQEEEIVRVGLTKKGLIQSVLTGAFEDKEKAAKIDSLTDSLRGITSALESLKEFRQSLSLSDLSPLSPTAKLAEARRQYEEILGKARGGDVGAAGQLPAFARAFLEASRSVNASGAAYQRDFLRVTQESDEIIKLFEDQRNLQQQQLDVLNGIREGLGVIYIDSQQGTNRIVEAVMNVSDAFVKMTEGASRPLPIPAFFPS